MSKPSTSIWVTSTLSGQVHITGLPPIGSTPVLLKGGQAETAQALIAIKGSPLRMAEVVLNEDNEDLIEVVATPTNVIELDLGLSTADEIATSKANHPASGKP